MNDSKQPKIAVLGAGSFGTALSKRISNEGHRITLWALEPEVVAEINEQSENKTYLPGIKLSDRVVATGDYGAASECDIVMMVVPVQHTAAVLKKVTLKPGATLVICSKGIEKATGRLLSQVVEEIQPQVHIAVLGGPTFARELALGLPCGATVACNDLSIAKFVALTLGSRKFRLYVSNDVIGAQVGGAMKNILAIACGIAKGQELGESAQATLLSRGFAETKRFALALGAQMETLLGLCGFGDIVLTCTSEKSRNTSLGIEIGKGAKLETILSQRRTVSEGVYSAPVVRDMARKMNVKMPIVEGLVSILNEDAEVGRAIQELLSVPMGIGE